jgi:cysteinyl-tRNA synthetase
VQKARELVRDLGEILGLELTFENSSTKQVEPFVQLLLDSRKRLRDQNNYELADFIREGLENLDVNIEDSKNETKWNFRSDNSK